MSPALSKDATLKDLALPRSEAERFLRRVLGVMTAYKQHGDVAIRVGITGTGQAPNYRLEADGRSIVALNGANHRPWPEGSPFEGSENWSSETMTYGEVQSALALVVPAAKGSRTS